LFFWAFLIRSNKCKNPGTESGKTTSQPCKKHWKTGMTIKAHFQMLIKSVLILYLLLVSTTTGRPPVTVKSAATGAALPPFPPISHDFPATPNQPQKNISMILTAAAQSQPFTVSTRSFQLRRTGQSPNSAVSMVVAQHRTTLIITEYQTARISNGEQNPAAPTSSIKKTIRVSVTSVITELIRTYAITVTMCLSTFHVQRPVSRKKYS